MLRKLKERPAKQCWHLNHEIPSHMYLENGTYEHICDGCGKKTIFTVNHPTFNDVRVRYSQTAQNSSTTRTCFCYGYGGHPDCPFED